MAVEDVRLVLLLLILHTSGVVASRFRMGGTHVPH